MGLRSTRRFAVTAAVASLAMVLSACGGDDSASGDTVKLAYVGALTGDNANLGINMRNGARVAIQEAQDRGVEVELVEYDTQGDPAQASSIKDRFLADDSVVGIVGPGFSGETRALLPDLQANGLVMVSASATAVDLPDVVEGQTVFHRVIPNDDAQGAGLAKYIAGELNPTSVAYVNDNSDYGKPLTESTQQLTEAAGVATATTAVVDPNSQDFSAAVTQITSSGANVVFYGGYYAEAGRLAKQLKDAGSTAQFLSADGSFDPGFITAAGTQADGAQVSCPCALASPESEGALGEFATKYAEVNDGAKPGTYSSESYDAANVLIAGIEDGNTDRESLLEFVENFTPTEGITKNIGFADNGNIDDESVFYYRVENGEFVTIGSNSTLGLE